MRPDQRRLWSALARRQSERGRPRQGAGRLRQGAGRPRQGPAGQPSPGGSASHAPDAASVSAGRDRDSGERGLRWRDRDRGSVTAELAVGLPALMLLLFVGLTAVNAVTTKLQCVDAAREAARTAARGEQGDAAGRWTAPGGADIAVTWAGDTVTATVRAPVRPLGHRLPSLSVQASAVAAVEPGPAR